MRYEVFELLLSIAGTELVCAADAITKSNTAIAEVAPLFG